MGDVGCSEDIGGFTKTTVAGEEAEAVEIVCRGHLRTDRFFSQDG